MDTETKTFIPPRRRGLLFNLGIIFLLTLASLALLFVATGTPLGPGFLLYLLGALFIAAPIPVLAYRTINLMRGEYRLGRSGIELRWGFREEDIPMEQIEYVELAEDLLFPLELPRWRWPGVLVGINQQEKLGRVEFLAAERDTLVMIGTGKRVFIISPEKPKLFVRTYRQMIELGSLVPMQATSSFPRFLLIEIWRVPINRALLIVSMVLSLALFVLVGWSVPTLSEVSLGFNAQGNPLPPVSSAQLFLLPSLNLVLVLAGYALSLLFIRQKRDHPIVTLLWGSSVLMSALFLVAVLFILSAS